MRADAFRRLVIAAVLASYSVCSLAQETTPTAAAPAETTPAPAADTPGPPEAPFGLEWLAGKDDTANLGTQFKSRITTEFGDSYVAARLPKELPDLHYAVLSFGYDNRLIRITAIGQPIADDGEGHRIKARYEELRQLLAKRYGEGKSEEHTDAGLAGGSYLLGLNGKKNWMYTRFAAADLRVELSIFADSMKSQWRMIFEYLPGMERLQHQRKQTEEEAF